MGGRNAFPLPADQAPSISQGVPLWSVSVTRHCVEVRAAVAPSSPRTKSAECFASLATYSLTRPPPDSAVAADKDLVAEKVVATDLDEAATGKASFLTLQALCRCEGIDLPKTVVKAFNQARSWVTAAGQLDIFKAERDEAKAEGLSSRPALPETGTSLHDIIGSQQILLGMMQNVLFQQQKELGSRQASIRRLLRGVVADRPVRTTHERSLTDKAQLPLSKRQRTF